MLSVHKDTSKRTGNHRVASLTLCMMISQKYLFEFAIVVSYRGSNISMHVSTHLKGHNTLKIDIFYDEMYLQHKGLFVPALLYYEVSHEPWHDKTLSKKRCFQWFPWGTSNRINQSWTCSHTEYRKQSVNCIPVWKHLVCKMRNVEHHFKLGVSFYLSFVFIFSFWLGFFFRLDIECTSRKKSITHRHSLVSFRSQEYVQMHRPDKQTEKQTNKPIYVVAWLPF